MQLTLNIQSNFIISPMSFTVLTPQLVPKLELHLQAILAGKTNKQTNSIAFSPQANYTNSLTPTAGKVVPTFVGRGCCMVSAVNPFGR
jgi:hypothetical protein